MARELDVGQNSVPVKLSENILRWELIEMAEMLRGQASASSTSQATEIFSWLQCFSTYVSVLSSRYPDLMAYLITITRVSQDFTGLACMGPL